MDRSSISKTAAIPFSTFTDAELQWLRTTAAEDVQLVLDVDETDDTADSGQTVYASVPGERPDLLFWFLLATPAGVSVQRSAAAPMVMDSWQNRMVADSDEGGHLFQSDRGHPSNLMAAT